MRCYKVHGNGYTRFAGSQGDARAARAARQSLADDSGKSKSSFSIDQVEIPTAKEGLLAFVNDLSEKLDPQDNGD